MHSLHQLRRYSRLMQVVTVASAVLTLLGGVWYLIALLTDPEFAEHFGRSVTEGPVTITGISSGVTALLLAISLSIMFAALYCVWRMFSAFAAAEPLSTQSAVWMNRAGIAFMAVAVGNIVLNTAMSVVLTAGNPPGQRSFTICVGTDDLMVLVMATVMFVTGRVLVLATEIRSEQLAFV